MKCLEGAGKCLLSSRHTDEMNVVIHEAVCPDLEGIAITVFLEPFKVLQKIAISLENRVTIVSALSDMVGVSGGYDASYTGHIQIVA